MSIIVLFKNLITFYIAVCVVKTGVIKQTERNNYKSSLPSIQQILENKTKIQRVLLNQDLENVKKENEFIHQRHAKENPKPPKLNETVTNSINNRRKPHQPLNHIQPKISVRGDTRSTLSSSIAIGHKQKNKSDEEGPQSKQEKIKTGRIPKGKKSKKKLPNRNRKKHFVRIRIERFHQAFDSDQDTSLSENIETDSPNAVAVPVTENENETSAGKSETQNPTKSTIFYQTATGSSSADDGLTQKSSNAGEGTEKSETYPASIPLNHNSKIQDSGISSLVSNVSQVSAESSTGEQDLESAGDDMSQSTLSTNEEDAKSSLSPKYLTGTSVNGRQTQQASTNPSKSTVAKTFSKSYSQPEGKTVPTTTSQVQNTSGSTNITKPSFGEGVSEEQNTVSGTSERSYGEIRTTPLENQSAQNIAKYRNTRPPTPVPESYIAKVSTSEGLEKSTSNIFENIGRYFSSMLNKKVETTVSAKIKTEGLLTSESFTTDTQNDFKLGKVPQKASMNYSNENTSPTLSSSDAAISETTPNDEAVSETSIRTNVLNNSPSTTSFSAKTSTANDFVSNSLTTSENAVPPSTTKRTLPKMTKPEIASVEFLTTSGVFISTVEGEDVNQNKPIIRNADFGAINESKTVLDQKIMKVFEENVTSSHNVSYLYINASKIELSIIVPLLRNGSITIEDIKNKLIEDGLFKNMSYFRDKMRSVRQEIDGTAVSKWIMTNLSRHGYEIIPAVVLIILLLLILLLVGIIKRKRKKETMARDSKERQKPPYKALKSKGVRETMRREKNISSGSSSDSEEKVARPLRKLSRKSIHMVDKMSHGRRTKKNDFEERRLLSSSSDDSSSRQQLNKSRTAAKADQVRGVLMKEKADQKGKRTLQDESIDKKANRKRMECKDAVAAKAFSDSESDLVYDDRRRRNQDLKGIKVVKSQESQTEDDKLKFKHFSPQKFQRDAVDDSDEEYDEKKMEKPEDKPTKDISKQRNYDPKEKKVIKSYDSETEDEKRKCKPLSPQKTKKFSLDDSDEEYDQKKRRPEFKLSKDKSPMSPKLKEEKSPTSPKLMGYKSPTSASPKEPKRGMQKIKHKSELPKKQISIPSDDSDIEDDKARVTTVRRLSRWVQRYFKPSHPEDSDEAAGERERDRESSQLSTSLSRRSSAEIDKTYASKRQRMRNFLSPSRRKKAFTKKLAKKIAPSVRKIVSEPDFSPEVAVPPVDVDELKARVVMPQDCKKIDDLLLTEAWDRSFYTAHDIQTIGDRSESLIHHEPEERRKINITKIVESSAAMLGTLSKESSLHSLQDVIGKSMTKAEIVTRSPKAMADCDLRSRPVI